MENITIKEAVIIAIILVLFMVLFFMNSRIENLYDIIRQLQMEIAKVKS